MMDEKDKLPSDAEDGGLKPKGGENDAPKPPPPANDEKVEDDPSEQPS